MKQLSVVIICKNEADIIGQTLQSLQGLTDDIIVYDNGSTDNTIEEIKKLNTRFHQGNWKGFGKTKNKAIAFAKYDWILSLDADEAISDELKKELSGCQPENEKTVYKLSFRNFIGNKMLKHGDWGRDYHIRLFNRNIAKWNEADVHEELILPDDVVIKDLKGYILHRTWRNMEVYKNKMQQYALLGAEKYFKQGKKAGWLKQKFSPSFSFIRSYVLKLGFLDGKAGYTCAKMIAYYTSIKYEKLSNMNRQSATINKQPVS
jgi:glycosyltransferase involved in cell wall biosynthesis